MVRSRTAQLIFQSFYVAIGLVGIVGSLGFYEHSFDDVFYVYFTNLSNYLCIAVMLLELIQTAQRKADGFVTLSPAVKFISVTAILLTFFVFNILLAGAPDRDPAQNFTITSISFHVVLPLLFVFDWILFYEHGRVKWTYPLYSTIFPLMYLAFVYIRAWMVGFDLNVPKLYPYFFINLDEQGVAGVVRWVVILLVAVIVVAMNRCSEGSADVEGQGTQTEQTTDSTASGSDASGSGSGTAAPSCPGSRAFPCPPSRRPSPDRRRDGPHRSPGFFAAPRGPDGSGRGNSPAGHSPCRCGGRDR